MRGHITCLSITCIFTSGNNCGFLSPTALSQTIVYVYFSFLGMLKIWRQQKRKVDAENEKVFRARAILARNCKGRVLQAWRVVNQEQQIISPMVARRDRKEMARYAKSSDVCSLLFSSALGL